MNFANIPAEMKFYRQWVVWRLEDHGGPKPTKVPYSPIIAGAKAAVDKPGTWGTFEDALAAFETQIFAGIGFVLTKGDPYAFVDLDDPYAKKPDGAFKEDDPDATFHRQQAIFGDFNTFAERSPSGTGLHLICKGSIAGGRKRSSIEVYSDGRYMTMTGDVYRDAPIAECQDQLTALYNQLGGPTAIHDNSLDQPQREEDQAIIERASSAVNGDKFKALYNGDWESSYASGSEADFALVDIIAFYTQNREQIARIFKHSPLYRVEKYGDRDFTRRQNLIDHMVNRAFDRQLPQVDLEGAKINWDAIVPKEEQIALPGMEAGNGAAEGPTAPALAAPGRTASDESRSQDAQVITRDMPQVQGSGIVLPPGFLGECANFIYEQAPRPVPEIALVGAIGLAAGIVGRAFNVSATGLNMYVLSLAPTGTGKEAINQGISKLLNEVRIQVPGIGDFMGPGDTRSDAALIKWLAKYPCILSVQGEWGMRLKQMSSPYANSNEIGVKKVIMDLFNKSGHGNVLNPLAYSDRDKNTPAIANPSFSLIGESTPEKFYEALDETMIADGLLPRFLTIEYHGERPARSTNAQYAKPSFGLTDMTAKLAAHCFEIMARGGVVNIQLDPYAEKLLDDFDKYADAMINDHSGNEVSRQMWNRAHIKALKLSGLVAVGCGPFNPIVDRDCARWACDIVAKDIVNVIDRFTRGEVGASVMGVNEARQLDDMRKVIRRFVTDADEAGKYNTPGNIHAAGVVLGSALTRRLFAMASYRNDRLGASNAIKRSLQHLLDADEIREIPKKQMADTFGTSARAFAITNPHSFR